MINITDAILIEAIEPLETVFDTHAVIKKVMQVAPRQYAVDLAATKGDDPIKTLHGQIGKSLLKIGTIAATKKVTSENVRGQVNENQEWRKI